MLDLRSFLTEIDNAIFRPDAPVAVMEEVTALQHALYAKGTQPVVHVTQPKLPDGSISDVSIVTNLTASREICARALGIDDHRMAARFYADKTTGGGIPPEVIGRAEAPVQEIVAEGDQADATALPAMKQHGGDAGRYFTAGHMVTYDPDTGIDNMAITRCWLREPRLLGCYPYRGSHNWLNVEKFWARGEAAPVALWIGHHPAVGMGTQAKIGYPESHWSAAGGVVGNAIRLVPSVTHGDKVMVPADAEIVIEGFIPPGRMEAEGPFAEFTGYQGAQVDNPVLEITAVTRRADAIYHDCGSGLSDHLVPDNMAMEGAIFAMCRHAAPTLKTVHVPVSGRRFHAYLQFDKPRAGEARDALVAAISYKRLKAAFAVDADIDAFDDRAIMWAMATRLQWHRDIATIDSLGEANLDPSSPPGTQTSTKAIFDATLPQPRDPRAPGALAPVNTVGDDAAAAAQRLLDGVDPSGWPQQ